MNALKNFDCICICIVNLRMTSEMRHLFALWNILTYIYTFQSCSNLCIDGLMDNLHTPLVISFYIY